MSLVSLLFGRKQQEVFDHNPRETSEVPARPYRILRADLPFYADAECSIETKGARLMVLRCEDPNQKHQTVECMPTRKRYSQGQVVQWELDKDRVWDTAWYFNPDTGKKEKAWARAVEFAGRIVKAR